MSLLDEINNDQIDNPRVTCQFGKMLSQQTEEQRKEILEVLETELPATQIASALEKFRGISIQSQAIRRHRRSECMCGR